MYNKITKMLGMILCIVIVFTSIPMQGFAALAEEIGEIEQEIEIIEPDYSTGNTTTELRLPDVQTESSPYEEVVYGEPVEVNEYSKVYKIDENTYTSVYSSVPNFYYDEKGNIKEYDNSLTYENNLFGADEFTNISSDIDVAFSTNMLKKGMSFEKNEVKVSLIPVEGDYSKYVVVDNAVRYNDVFDGVDVQYTVEENSVREFIILNKEVDKNVFTYELELNGHHAELIENVLYIFENDASEEYAYTISAPVMTDAAGATSKNITLALEDENLILTADAEWLHAVERAYPVYIDPDITIDYKGIKLRTVCSDTDRVYVSGTPYAYGYAGYMLGSNFGVNGQNLEYTKMIIDFDDSYFSNIPEGAGIKSAEFDIFQYVGYPNVAEPTVFDCFMINTDWSISDYTQGSFIDKPYTAVGKFDRTYLSSSKTKTRGYHKFDVREAVNSWVNWPETRNGLLITSKYGTNKEIAGAFITPTSSANIQSYAENKPFLKITWEIPNPVDVNYDINNTTIDIRTIGTSSPDGKLAILGIFADGIAKPNSVVNYVFSDSSVEYQTEKTMASVSYKYPDSSAWDENFSSQGRATKYKDILSNWQTLVPFTNFNYNQLYNWGATATKDGVTGKTAKSVDFLVYKVTRYDTLASIANYYGVPLDQLAKDNHVQDMLLVENNTIIVINPTRNANIPYNPGELTDEEKRRIDGSLMGRSKHCEFGFEPVNLNTGNFYMNQTDISIDDIGGEFAIGRTYNSKGADVNSVFGRGWQFDYSEHLSKLEDGTIVYRRGDGSSVYFTKNADGSYSCAPGYYLDITPIVVETKLGDFGGEEPEEYNVYEYEIRNAEDEVRRFSSRGLLQYIIDDRGFKTSIEYDENSNLKSITSPSGNVYGITSELSGLIKAISGPGGQTIKYAYNDAGDLVSYTNELGYVTTYNYNADHLMTSWADAEGNVIVTNTYDADGRVTKQVDSEGGTTLFEYGKNYTKTTDANGNATTYNYDDNYRTTSIVYADGSAEYKYYDAANNLSKTVDRSGKATEYKYNADGFVTEVKRFDGATQKMQYDADNNVIKTTDFEGKSISYTYDAKGNLLTQTNKDGSVKAYEYDSNYRVTKFTDELGNVSTYKYDGIWVSEIKDANGNITKYYYNARGDVVTTIDALGNTTRHFYDAAGRNTGYQTADGATVSYTYDKAGCMVYLKNANGYVYTYEYDGMGNITKLIDPLDNEVVYTYDGLYNTLSTAYSAENITYSEYDCFSQVVTVTDEEGNKKTFKYDNAGNVIETADAEGNTTKYAYDLRFNKIATETDALGNVTTYEYDVVGNLTKKTDANGNVTSYAYDAKGNVTEIKYSSGLVVAYTYDAVGNLLTTTSNAGENTVYTYDKVYNVTSVTYSNGATLSYTYDAMGRKLTEKDSSGAVTTYTYDAMGRQSSITDAIGRRTEYTYDKNGNLLTEKTSNGGTTTYVYDALDRQCKVTDALGNSTIVEFDSVGNMLSTTNALGARTAYEYNRTGLVTKQTDAMGGVFTFTYDKNGNVIKAKDAAGYEATITYDALGRTVATKDALGLETTFKYDALGNLSEDANNNGVKNTYEYDSAGNLVKSTDSLGQVMTYTYDLNGNLTSVKSYDGTTTSYTYDKLNNVTSTTDAEGKVTTYSYDIIGNLTFQKDAQNRTYSYSYDKAGRTIQVVDPLGQITKYEYNEFDFVTKQTNPDKTTITNTYDVGGNLISSTDANGHSTTYSYDKIYRLISVAYADGSTNKYKYDNNDNLVKFTDANGNVTEYTYNALGYTESITEANGAKTTYKNDANGNVLSETDALGSATNYIYDKESRLVSKTLANIATYTYTYDVLGRITAETLPESLSVSYVYDSKGDLVSETDQSGRKTSYTYDVMHRITSTTDAVGNVTKFAYDDAGNLKSLTTAKGYVTEYKYDALDRITELLNPVGKTEQYTYDPVGNLTSVVETGGRVTKYGYDNVGNLTSVTNALGFTKTLKYDCLDRLVSESDYKGKSEKYDYDNNGNLTSVADSRGNKIVYTYDNVNNLISEVDAEDRRKDYSYDAVGRLTSVTEDSKYQSTYIYDKVGNLLAAGGYTYSYDLNGNLTSSTNALGDITSYVYNENGMLETVRNADGTTVNYDYDKIDQLISKKYDEETVALYGYDADGNRVSMEDIAGTSNYQYDELGRVTEITLSDGKSQITYEYDVYGNLTKLGYPDGTDVTYKYNALNQLVSITNRDGENTAYKYDPNGNVKEVHRPNNTYTLIEYNENDQITSLINYGMVNFAWFFKKTVEFSSYKYEYDGSGNIVKESEKTFSSTGENDFFTWLIAQIKKETVTKTYKYDGRNQLVEVDESKKSLFSFGSKGIGFTSYEYDASGNRIKEVKNGETTKYTYNEAGQLVSMENCDGTTEYTYDKNGNLINEKSPTCLIKTDAKIYSYDNENRLTAIKENGTLLMAALYDGDGERLFVVSDHDGCSVACCNDKSCKNLSKSEGIIDVDEELIKNIMLIPNGVDSCDFGDYDLTGYINNVNTEYTQVLMEYAANGKLTAAYEYGVFRESANINGEQFYYDYDGKGSVVDITNTNGKKATTYSYDAYGNATVSGNSVENPYQYNAEYVDNATGLQYLRARYYRAETGSFITADIYAGNLQNPLSLNRYTYTHNNPVNYDDPSGHIVISTGVAILIGLVSVGGGGFAYYKGRKSAIENQNNTFDSTIAPQYSKASKVSTGNVYNIGNKSVQAIEKDGKSSYAVYIKKVNQTFEYSSYQQAKKICDSFDKLDLQWGLDNTHAWIDAFKSVPVVGVGASIVDAGVYSGEILHYSERGETDSANASKNKFAETTLVDTVSQVVGSGLSNILGNSIVKELVRANGKHSIIPNSVIKEGAKVLTDVLSGELINQSIGLGQDIGEAINTNENSEESDEKLNSSRTKVPMTDTIYQPPITVD
ncbi:MAG: LysM peptidoglycan-binding domain-containing protein [Clostridia bacterium]|nr:LysM peptidoglycan-binding domain-containing protein [Clostridia bacterium]